MITEDIRRYYKAVSPPWRPLNTLTPSQHRFIQQTLAQDPSARFLRSIEVMIDAAVYQDMKAWELKHEDPEETTQPGG